MKKKLTENKIHMFSPSIAFISQNEIQPNQNKVSFNRSKTPFFRKKKILIHIFLKKIICPQIL